MPSTSYSNNRTFLSGVQAYTKGDDIHITDRHGV